MLHEARHPAPPSAWSPPLPRRTPGEADLRVFTIEHPIGGRHRPSRRSLRVGRDRLTGRPVLRVVALALLVVLAASCASGAATGTGGQSARTSAPKGDALNLRGVCPAT